VADGYLMNDLLRSELSTDLGWWLWALVFLAVAIGVNYTGANAGIGAIALTAAIAVVPLAVVAVAIIVKGGADGNTLAVFDPSRTSWNAVFHGILFAVSLFIGFEAVAALGEEARLPHRSIPIAVISSVAICLAFYLVVSYAGAIGFRRAGAPAERLVRVREPVRGAGRAVRR
jgi:amino acid transporter